MGMHAHILTLFSKDSKFILYNLNLTPRGTRNLGNTLRNIKMTFKKSNKNRMCPLDIRK